MTTSIRGAGGKIIIISTIWSDHNDKKVENGEDAEDEDYGDLGYEIKRDKFEKSSKLVKNIIAAERAVTQQLTTNKNNRFVYMYFNSNNFFDVLHCKKLQFIGYPSFFSIQ